MAASAKSRRACGPSFVFLASARSCDALKSPRNDTGIDMTNLHRSPPMNQSETDLGIVNESQLLRFGISVHSLHVARLWRLLVANSRAGVRRGGWRDVRRSCAAGRL